MTELENITFVQYVELKDKSAYDYAATYSRVLNTPVDIFKVGMFNKLTFGQVKDLQTTFASGVDYKEMINFVCNLKKLKLKEVVLKPFFEICKFRSYVISEIEKIQRIEESLNYKVSAQDKTAGIEKLAKFGVGIQIDKLAMGKIWMYETVRKQDYEKAFFKLLMDKEINEYNAIRNKLNQKK